MNGSFQSCQQKQHSDNMQRKIGRFLKCICIFTTSTYLLHIFQAAMMAPDQKNQVLLVALPGNIMGPNDTRMMSTSGSSNFHLVPSYNNIHFGDDVIIRKLMISLPIKNR